MEWDESKHPRGEDGRWTENANAVSRDLAKIERARRIYDSASQENTSATNFSYPTIHLPREEYAMVMHELATNLTKEEHSYPIAVKHIRNYTYRVEILGFGNYRIIGKWKIPTRRRNKRK